MDAVTEDCDPIHLPPPRAPELPGAPRVRTLLVCDLADSTALVERLGDTPASELIRRHDRLARDLMHRHGGREIDKTDGFLVLFDRPVEAVAFALSYQRALQQLSDEVRQSIRARVGIHVGEVVVWENSVADVASGAKRVDVEGLAKPVVARLMTLALPGQIILSGVAYSLAQRAERELDAGLTLRWLTHGRYRFKGVAAPMLVHEVGESGFAPLQAPPSSPKAQREVPLWRKPTVLALEAVALLAAIAVPLALSLRAPTAIAFGERDWIVMGDLRNLTGESVLDDSLETAFRISLEQSRYVNVLPDLKLRGALERMQRAADTPIDREIASEIAIREGARAVILPTVAEIGGRVRVSAEVIDPSTQTTVYAESADGVGARSTLTSIDRVTNELRHRLGEALASIKKDSAPLPRITSANLDALRAYALGVKAQADGDGGAALRLYEQSLALDPDFALAHLGMARVLMAALDRVGAEARMQAVQRLRDRLSPRDALYADAWIASFGPVQPMLEKWQLLGTLYPDYFAAHYNYALYQMLYANRPDLGLDAVKLATSVHNPLRGWAFYLLGTQLLGLDRLAEAEQAFREANALGVTGIGEPFADVYAAQRRYPEARAVLAAAQPYGVASNDIYMHLDRISLPLDQGKWNEALAAARVAQHEALKVGPLFGRVFDAIHLTLQIHEVDRARLAAQVQQMREQEQQVLDGDPAQGDRHYAAFSLLLSGYVAARAGLVEDVDAALLAFERVDPTGYPMVERMHLLLRAEQNRLAGRPALAVAQLESQLDGGELYQMRVALMLALDAAGRTEDALRQAHWLATHRGKAYGEWNSYNVLQALNVADSNIARLYAAEFADKLGRGDVARAELDAFTAEWPTATAPQAVAARIAAISRR